MKNHQFLANLPRLFNRPSTYTFLRQCSSQSQPNQWMKKLPWGVLASITGLTAGGLLYRYRDMGNDKKQPVQSFGKPSIGGDFNLIDHHGKPTTLASFKGQWVVLYFGFCRCPDICPEQLERLVDVVDRVSIANRKDTLVPVFVTVDPERDTPQLIDEYLKEFSPRFVGLTGTKEEINKMARQYRIYYSKGPEDCDGDYIVDHTIVMYLLNPDGEFVYYFGQVKPVQEAVRDILKHMKEYSANK